MPYNMSNPMNPERKEINFEEIKKELYVLLDEICTYLSASAHWNMKAANASRRLSVRGFGRYHDCCAKESFCALDCLEKIVGDKFGYTPKVNMQEVTHAEMYNMANFNDFKSHFKMWMDMEEELAECLYYASREAKKVDVQIYEKLFCMAEKAQNDKMRIRMIYDNLEFAAWNPHDISIKSMIIHDYFEHKHGADEEINLNLG